MTINPQTELRIVNPSAGLKAWYDQRANILNKHIDEVRKAKGRRGSPRAQERRDQARRAQEGGGQARRDQEGRDEEVSHGTRPAEMQAGLAGSHFRFSHRITVYRSRPHAVTPNIVSKATAPLPILSLACEAAQRLGASGVVIMPEGPLEWDLVRPVCAGGVSIFVASSSPRQIEAIRKAGLEPIEVEPTEAAIAERISLALIEAVANDQLKAGARVVVVYSGFEAEALDSLTVIRLGEHLERLTARDLRALETSVPFETLKAVVDTAVEIGREGREGKAVGTPDRRRRRAQRAGPHPPARVSTRSRATAARSGMSAIRASARRSRRSPRWTVPSSWPATARSKRPAGSSTPP